MADKTLNTRIRLKYDTLANWTSNNPVLLAGELAIVEVPNNVDPIHNAPAILMKVGDGTSTFTELGYELTEDIARTVSQTCEISNTGPRELTREEIYELLLRCK